MKQFLVFIGKILIALLASALILDLGYTYIYSSSIGRNKVENVINTHNKKFDVIMMGSSRANNHFVPQLFIDKGYSAFNYGNSGSKLQETALLLELMLHNNYSIKHLILEVDLNLNSDSFSYGNQAKYMPFLHSNSLISNYYRDKLSEFLTCYYVPFYRYIRYDPQIGFREIFFSLIRKPSNCFDHYGLFPLLNEGKNMEEDISKRTPKKNSSYELIKALCQKHSINLIVVSTPMCENTKGMVYFDKIKAVYPEIHNYENVVTEDRYFSSCGHLNFEGAKLLTSKIIADFFPSKAK